MSLEIGGTRDEDEDEEEYEEYGEEVRDIQDETLEVAQSPRTVKGIARTTIKRRPP
jgi:hypothetical protein